MNSSTFSTLPAASTVPGEIYLVTDVGDAPGSLMISDGVRWKAVSGRIRLATLVTPATGLTNSEVISLQSLLPAGLMNAGDEIQVGLLVNKSGSTDSANVQVRCGTAGTPSDAPLLASANTIMVAGLRSAGVVYAFKLASATTMQRGGNTSSGSYVGNSVSDIPAAVAIPNASSNALYLGVSLVSSGITNTVGIYGGHIDLVTP